MKYLDRSLLSLTSAVQSTSSEAKRSVMTLSASMDISLRGSVNEEIGRTDTLEG